MNINDISKYTANLSKSRKFITSLRKPGVILPVILLESTVTLGRTYQAYKRDGFVEARERVTEESLGAIFWLFGATMFAKLIQSIGQKFMHIPETDIDVGQDKVRKPFKNFVLDNLGNKHYTDKRLASFYFSKVALSLVAACAFIGFVVPKFNQAITKHIFKHGQSSQKPANSNNTSMVIEQGIRRNSPGMHALNNVSINSVQEFKKKENRKNLSFGISAATLTQIIQKFDENAIYKLLGTDVGTVSGRTINARNKDERVEILFRDIVSIFFYCFSTDMLFNLFNKHDKFKGENTILNPTTSAEVHNHLLEKMKDQGKTSMSTQEFEKFALGNKKLEGEDKALFEKLFPPKPTPKQKKLFGIFEIKSQKWAHRFGLISEIEKDVIDLDEYKRIIKENVTDKTKIDRLISLGEEMSKLQPEISVQIGDTITTKKIITETQVEDIFKGGVIREPGFMKQTLNNIFKTPKNWISKGHPNRLTDRYQYISQASIDGEKNNIYKYVESLIKTAENGEVNWNTMLKANKRNMTRNGLYMGVSMGISALFLSTIIPKVQYWITRMRTGQDKFPGTENMTR